MSFLKWLYCIELPIVLPIELIGTAYGLLSIVLPIDLPIELPNVLPIGIAYWYCLLALPIGIAYSTYSTHSVIQPPGRLPSAQPHVRQDHEG